MTATSHQSPDTGSRSWRAILKTPSAKPVERLFETERERDEFLSGFVLGAALSPFVTVEVEKGPEEGEMTIEILRTAAGVENANYN